MSRPNRRSHNSPRGSPLTLVVKNDLAMRIPARAADHYHKLLKKSASRALFYYVKVDATNDRQT